MHIFLSYPTVDEQFCLKLAADLKNAGLRVWMDRLETKAGDQWYLNLQNALTREQCAGLIAALSQDYLKSLYCQKELLRVYHTLRRPVLPIILREIEADRRPIELEGTQYLDFRHWQDESFYRRQLEKLIDAIRTALGAQAGEIPSLETQYLNRLIAELESRRGVLSYIELSNESYLSDVRPQPLVNDEWGFAELLKKDSALRKSTKITFNSIEDAVTRLPRFVLLADPGAGKTTTLRRLALIAARKRLANPRDEPIPLLLYLSRWDKEVTLADFVQAHWPLGTNLSELLKSGDVFLLLDGLNEMGTAGADKAKSLCQWLYSQNGPQRLIVTCRKADYVCSQVGQ